MRSASTRRPHRPNLLIVTPSRLESAPASRRPVAEPAAEPSIVTGAKFGSPEIETDAVTSGSPPGPTAIVELPAASLIRIRLSAGVALTKVMASRSVQVPVPVRAHPPGPPCKTSEGSLTTTTAARRPLTNQMPSPLETARKYGKRIGLSLSQLKDIWLSRTRGRGTRLVSLSRSDRLGG